MVDRDNGISIGGAITRIRDAELPTVLLALRYLQANRDDAIDTITEGGSNPYGEILSEDEINNFCERINQ